MVPRRNLWRTLLHGRRDLGLRSPARRRAPADAGLLLRPVAAALPGLDRHHDARRHLRRRAAGPGTLRPRLRLPRRLPHTAGQIGSAHVRNPVTTAPPVTRLLIEKTKN